MRNDQLGANSGPGTGLAPSQYPHPNEAGYPGTGVQDPHNKPSKIGGKVQTAIGTMVGSDTLRAKGMEKERFVCFAFCLNPSRLNSPFPHTQRSP